MLTITGLGLCERCVARGVDRHAGNAAHHQIAAKPAAPVAAISLVSVTTGMHGSRLRAAADLD